MGLYILKTFCPILIHKKRYERLNFWWVVRLHNPRISNIDTLFCIGRCGFRRTIWWRGRFSIFCGCFSAKSRKLIVSDFTFKGLIGWLHVDFPEIFNITVWENRLPDFQSFIGEIFRVQIHDYQGQKPPISLENVKSDNINFRALPENHPSLISIWRVHSDFRLKVFHEAQCPSRKRQHNSYQSVRVQFKV